MFSKRCKGALSKKEALNLLRSAHIDMSEIDVIFCYGMSKMSVINEAT